MIFSIINSFNMDSGDYAVDRDDLFQEGCLALYRAVNSYDEKYATKFSSYAYLLIRSRIINVLKKQQRTYDEERYSLDNYENPDHVAAFSCADQALAYHRETIARNHLRRFYDALPEQDRQIIELRKKAYTYKQIAGELAIDAKKVDNRIAAIRRALKADLKKSHIQTSD